MISDPSDINLMCGKEHHSNQTIIVTSDIEHISVIADVISTGVCHFQFGEVIPVAFLCFLIPIS